MPRIYTAMAPAAVTACWRIVNRAPYRSSSTNAD
jgi:hypothetical protein